MNSDFHPAWWLRNAHAQTSWASLIRKKLTFDELWERVELPDGDFLDIVWDKSNAHETHKPIVMILHGLGGNLQSHYAKGLIISLSKNGFRPLFMHYRGSSGVPNRLARNYHSGDTNDLSFVVEKLKKTHSTPLYGVGISIGANVIIKWLGETGSSNPLNGAVAISPPFDLATCSNTFMKGFARVYQWWVLKPLIQEMNVKFNQIPCPFNKDRIRDISNFWEFDSLITAPLNGFRDVHDYYKKSSCRQYLPGITIPTVVIHSRDDPFMTPAVIPNNSEIPNSVKFELSSRGGHVGFITGNCPGNAKYWLEERINTFLNEGKCSPS